MRTLITINNLGVGGAEHLVVDDINEMLKRGMDVWLMTLKPEKGDKSLSSQCRIPESHWIKINFGSLLNIRSWLRVVKKVRSIKPDVMICHLWYSNLIGRVTSKICGIKTVITFEHNVYDSLKTRKMFFTDRIFQNISSYVVAVSSAVKDSLVRHGIKNSKIKVIHNGIDISKYKNRQSKNIRQELSVGSDFVFVFIGRLIRQKGVDVLIKAFAQTENSRLLMVGMGEEKQSLMSLAKGLSVENRVHFLGFREDIPDILANADCFVLPSRYEGLPIVLLEAVASEKAIIVSDFQSSSEIIKNGTNGIIVPKENVDELAKAMNLVAQNKDFRHKLSENIRIGSESISIENHVDTLLSCINQ